MSQAHAASTTTGDGQDVPAAQAQETRGWCDGREHEHRQGAVVLGAVAGTVVAGDGDQIAYCRAKWLLSYSSPHTRRAYDRDLATFAAWCEEYGVGLLAVIRAHVDAYARSLEAQCAAPATVGRALAAVSSFYGYLANEGVIGWNPVTRVRRPQIGDDSQTTGLDRDEVCALLATAAKDSPRAHALVSLLALNGLRVGEALGADVGDVGHGRGHRILLVTRKGGKRAIIPLAPNTAAAIDAYLDGRTDGVLFATRTGRRMDEAYVWRLIRRLAKDAGIPSAGKICPLSLRHSFVTLSLDSGATLQEVQDAAGHADPKTTQRYNRARHNLDNHPTYGLVRFLAG